MARDDQPLLLAIEASGELGGAAVLRGENVIANIAISARRAHGQLLVPAIRDTLEHANIAPHQLYAIVFNRGPGSYTGTRVGLAAAQMLGYVYNVGLLGIGALDVLAEEWIRTEQAPSGELCLLPCLDARRDEVVCAPFRYAQETLERMSDDRLIAPSKLAKLAPAGMKAIAFGSGANVYANDIALERRPSRIEISPASLGHAALRQVKEGRLHRATSRQTPVQLDYFRPILAQTIEQRQEDERALRERREET